MIAASFVGGSGFDTVGSIAVGNAYISGATGSTEDTSDAFVMKLRCEVSHEISGVFDAAGFQDLISPGSFVAVGGLFTEATATASTVPLSFDLNGFSVTFNDITGALFGVFDGPFDQANVQVPWDLDVSSGRVDVRAHWQGRDGEEDFWSEPFLAGAALASPGIFTVQFGPGPGVVTNFKLSAEDDVIPLSRAQPDGQDHPRLYRRCGSDHHRNADSASHAGGVESNQRVCARWGGARRHCADRDRGGVRREREEDSQPPRCDHRGPVGAREVARV